MKYTTLRGRYLNRLAALVAAAALAGGTPLAFAQSSKGSTNASQNANQNAVNHGANLGRGAAPLPEPGTWAAMGAMLVAAAALVAREKRRRSTR